ncbi:MAG: hypothetical protein EOO01_26635, partial [Chitinophagaceae bacterium]
MNTLYRHTIISVLIIFFCACGVKKYLPPGEKLYSGARISVKLAPGVKEKKPVLAKKLGELTKPKRNKKFLGRYNKVWWWYVIGESTKQKGFKHWLREQLGEEPVFFSTVDTGWNAQNIQMFLANDGYFNSQVSADTVARGYKVKAVYRVHVERPYLLDEVAWRLDSSDLSKEIVRLPLRESALRKGQRYDTDVIKAEAQRVSNLLKEKGYYYFKHDDILTLVDTNQNNHTASVFIGVEPKISPRHKVPFSINRIVTVVQHPRSTDSAATSMVIKDNIHVDDAEKKFKPVIFPRAITYRPGNLYSLPEQNRSISRLNSYGVFRFIRSEFKPAPGKNNMLDVYYYANPS